MQNQKPMNLSRTLKDKTTSDVLVETIRERLNADGVMRGALRDFLEFNLRELGRLLETCSEDNFKLLQGKAQAYRSLLRTFDL